MTTARRTRRSRPRIAYTNFNGTGTTIGSPIFSVTLLAEPSNIAEQLHMEELQVAGIYRMNTATVLGVATMSCFPERSGVTANFQDAGVRVRFMMGNDQGIPFLFKFKNMNLAAGHSLRVQMTPRDESSDAVHSVVLQTKVVFRELR